MLTRLFLCVFLVAETHLRRMYRGNLVSSRILPLLPCDGVFLCERESPSQHPAGKRFLPMARGKWLRWRPGGGECLGSRKLVGLLALHHLLKPRWVTVGLNHSSSWHLQQGCNLEENFLVFQARPRQKPEFYGN